MKFVVPLAAIEHARPVLDLLFAEAFSSHCGRRGAANRLFEVVIIHVLRFAMIQGHTSTGMLWGWATAASPERSWPCTRTRGRWKAWRRRRACRTALRRALS